MTLTNLNERCYKLGKYKRHRKEYRILKKIFEDPYPMEFPIEPISSKKYPDVLGWLYFHLDEMIPEEPLYPSEIAVAENFLDKVITKAWDIRDDENRRIHNIGLEMTGTYNARIPMWAREIGLKLGEWDSMTYEQAKTILHYMKFEKLDSEGILWSPKAP